MLPILRSIPTVLLLAGASALGGTAALVLEKKVGHLHYYKGTVVLTGEVERRTDKESLEQEGDNLCFKVSSESGIYIPRDGDQRAAWPASQSATPLSAH